MQQFGELWPNSEGFFLINSFPTNNYLNEFERLLALSKESRPLFHKICYSRNENKIKEN